MTLAQQLMYEIADSRGIDLKFLEQVAPETAANWRADHKGDVYAMHHAIIGSK